MLNKKFNTYLISIINTFLFLLNISFPQTDSSYLKTEEVLEDILQEPLGEFDDSNLYESIEDLLLNPININETTISDLQRIPGMDITSSRIIIDHRKRYGDFFSINELNAIKNLDKNLIKNISPFITVTPPDYFQDTQDVDLSLFENIIHNTQIQLRSRVSNDLQTRKGFLTGKFEGSKPKVYNRLLIKSSNKIQLGILSEKDAGESSLSEFNTYHLAFSDIGIIHRAVVMDYMLEFGQGLTFWNPFGFSKGSDAVYPVKRVDKIIKPYTSSTENNFFRGVAAAVELDNFIFTGFYSNNSFDANIDTATGEITSTPVDGLHRTELELRKRDSAREKMWGARIDYKSEKFLRTGILYYQSKFTNAFQSSSVFDLNGSRFNYTSFYYDFFIDKINLFGEFVYDGTSVASINSFQLNIIKDFSFIASIRSYPRNFISLHGFAFGERNGTTTNEFGIYTGIRWRTPVGILNFYYDQFKFPFSTFTVPRPAQGDEFLLDYLGKPLNRLETRIRYKYENKDVTQTIDNSKQLVKRLRQVYRAELIYKVSNKLRMKGRFEYNSFRISATAYSEDGYLIFQDVRFSPGSNFNLYGRIIFFKTDSFNSAVYEYENNLTGVLTNLALFGEGIRWYILLRYRILRAITLSVKYSETFKPGETTLGSGDSEIEGNLDNRIGIQLDIKF